MPNPLDGRIGGQWNGLRLLDRHGGFLVSFIYQETGSGEVHVNFHRWPSTRMPLCRAETSKRMIPCYSQPAGRVRANGIDARLYTVSRDADQWHLSYLWRHDGATYVVSEHVAPPYLVQPGEAQRDAHPAQPHARPATGVKLTRRQVLAGAAAGALGAAGAYELVDRLAGSSPDRGAAGPLPPEQHVLDGVRTVTDNKVEVMVPPLHHEVVTARVRVDRADLADAQKTLESALSDLEARFAPTPAGLGIAVAWGLPYFDRLVPAAWRANAPFDRRASRAALLPAERFKSDPDQTLLEENDLAVLLRSDHLDHIADGAKSLFDKLDLLRRHVDPQGLCGRRLRGRPQPAEGDGTGCRAFPARS